MTEYRDIVGPPSEKHGNYLVISNGTASENTSLIQSALDDGGDIFINGTGIIPISSRLVINSNTRLKIASGIEFKAVAAIGTMLVNKAYTLTPISCTATWAGVSSTWSAGEVALTITRANHGLDVGEYIWLRGATDKAFRGCFIVESVTDENNFVVSLWRASMSASSGTVAGTLSYVVADQNIIVEGGIWNYNRSGANSSISGSPSVINIIFAGIANSKIIDTEGKDTTKYHINIAAADNTKAISSKGNLSSDAVKIDGPARDCGAVGITATSGDDLFSCEPDVGPAYNYILVGEGGDVIGVTASNVNGKTTTRGLGVYSDSAGNTVRNIHYKDSNISAPIVVNIDHGDSGTAATTVDFDNILLENIIGMHSGALISLASAGICNIKNLVANNLFFRSKSSYGRFLYTGGYASTLRAVINGGFAESCENILNINAAVAKANIVINGLSADTVYVPFNVNGLATVVKVIGGLFSGSSENFISVTGANASVDINLDGSQITSTFNNFLNVGNVTKVDLYLKNVSISQDVSGTGSKYFIKVTAGSPVINLRGENVELVSTAGLSIAGTPTINCWEEGIKIDVGLLSLTAGQKAWHSSTVAGRDAANQQGPAFCNGTNWYALGTGTAGANTLIV